MKTRKHFDKVLHAIAGAVIALFSIWLLQITNLSEFTTHVIAFCAVILGGFGKEFYDWKFRHGFADMYDIIATVMGGIVIIGIDKFLI